MEKLTATARIQIAKTPQEVFDAIADPEKMKNYFISWGSSRMESGKSIQWKFPEFEEKFDVRVGEIREPKYISFFWEMDKDEMKIEIELEQVENSASLVSVTESGKELNEAGIAWLKGNTEGWANFLACLKAYLEYGINLRKGAFDFRRKV